jgi:iron complex transport system substrate-binding protein
MPMSRTLRRTSRAGLRTWAARLAAFGLVLACRAGLAQTPAAGPQRVVTLLPSLTESVCALGACDRLVGVDRHSNHPEGIRTLPRLGGLDDPRLEALVALRPDLVIAPQSWRGLDRLRGLGIAVLAIEPVSLEGIRVSLEQIGQALGLAPARAQQVWAGIEQDFREAAARIPTQQRGTRIYLEVSEVPHAASAGSFIGEMLGRIGLQSAFSADLGPFPRLSPEAVLRADPGWVVSAQSALRSMRQRPGLRDLAALRHGRACGPPPADFDLIVRPGPRLGEGAMIIATCLHP